MKQKNKHFNQSTNMYHSEHKQKTYVPKNTEVHTTQSSDNSSPQVSSNQNISKNINLGCSNYSSMRQFYISLQGSYQLISTKMIVPRR